MAEVVARITNVEESNGRYTITLDRDEDPKKLTTIYEEKGKEAGQLRVLCISTPQRSKSVLNVPTAIELGIKDFDYATMMGLQTSAGAARELVARLQGAVAKALREPDIVERMAVLGMELRESGTADYAQFMRDDIERYRSAMKTFKLQIN
jgi:tripartite-type tricarboxylate transporter receptor subunit TctC